MLAPRNFSALKCLRCDASLVTSRVAFSARGANFSTQPSSGDDGADALEQLSSSQPSGLKIIKEVKPLNRIRKHNGQVIRETSASLRGLKQLGQDADVLVLKEVQEPKSSESKPKPAIVNHAYVPDILASIQLESKKLTPKETYEQIQSLRPVNSGDPDEPQYVTRAAFAKLARVLTKGFTQQQLAKFYSFAKKEQWQSIDQKPKANGRRYNSKTKPQPDIYRTEWRPGVSDLETNSSQPSQPWSRRPLAGKQSLVERILQDVWKLVVMEQMEKPGEIEFFLHPKQIVLVNTGEDESIIDRIRRERRVKIDIVPKEGGYKLRITADQTSAEYAAEDMEEVLQNIVTRTLDVSHWLSTMKPNIQNARELLAQENLDGIGNLTHTVVQCNDQNILTIDGLYSNTTEEAARAIMRLLAISHHTSRSIDTHNLQSERKDSIVLSPVALNEDSLELQHREKLWGRYVLPIARSEALGAVQTESQDIEISEYDAKKRNATCRTVDRALESLNLESTILGPKEKTGHWASEIEWNLSAEIGQVLFPIRRESGGGGVMTGVGSPEDMSSIFLSSCPGLAHLLVLQDFNATSRANSPALTYRFIVHPEHSSDYPECQFPTLSIQVRRGRDRQEPYVHRVKLTLQEDVHDILLPGKATDIRLCRYARLELQNPRSDRTIQSWRDNVAWNIRSGTRLTAPDITIDIPRWILRGDRGEADAKATKKSKIKFLLSSVQVNQTVAASYRGIDVSLKTVESGRLGGNGIELSAYFKSSSDTKSDLPDKEEVREFIGKTFDLVDAVTVAAGKRHPVQLDAQV